MRKLRVLVVDDVEDCRVLNAMYLEAEGFVVDQATNGREALMRARAFAPDVVLLDLTLPLLSGWDVTRLLKAHPATRSIQVIAVSGRTDDVSRARARDAGCAAFLAKPCTPREIVDALARTVRASAAAVS
ncbi:MAG TPA: response regulator [Labilithrix sp.]|jgi:CheY-like chemotaxis protein